MTNALVPTYPPVHFHHGLDLGVVFEDLRAPGRRRMKLSSHPRFHASASRTLRQLKALSPPLAQSETQPTTAFSVAGCATGSARPSSAHNWGGLLSLYFGLFLYQVHRVAI